MGAGDVTVELDGHEVKISSPDKVFFSERGETKLDLVEFYAAIRGPLLAAILVDAENFFVPNEIPWITGALALLVHALTDRPGMPGALNAHPLLGAMALGAGIGVLISLLLLHKKILARSFEDGAPLLEIEKKELARQGQPEPPEFTPAQVQGLVAGVAGVVNNLQQIQTQQNNNNNNTNPQNTQGGGDNGGNGQGGNGQGTQGSSTTGNNGTTTVTTTNNNVTVTTTAAANGTTVSTFNIGASVVVANNVTTTTLATGTSVASVDAADSVRLAAAVSASPMVNASAPVLPSSMIA